MPGNGWCTTNGNPKDRNARRPGNCGRTVALWLGAWTAALAQPAAADDDDRGLRRTSPHPTAVPAPWSYRAVDPAAPATPARVVERPAKAGDELELLHAGGYQGLVLPGRTVVLRWDGGTGELSVHRSPLDDLGELAARAVARAPRPLRSVLAVRLAALPADDRDALARRILAPADARTTDEIAFVAASLSPSDVAARGFDPALLEENARAVYALDEALDYVALVDVGVPGVDDDYYTTARYRLADGEDVELPRELYYWYVVHPRVSLESVAYVDPVTGRAEAPADGGLFWRAYFAWQDVAPERSAWLHFVTEHPHRLDSAALGGWGPSAQGFLAGFRIDPLVLAADAAGAPVLVHFSHPGGQFDGTVLATTMPVERAWDAGRTELLENLVGAGAASARLPAGRVRVLVLQDRDPWGSRAVEHVLDDLGLDYDVVGSAALAATDLTAYHKLIVPSAQPRALYEALAAARGQLDAWLGPEGGEADLGYERVLELHGATDLARPEDDWCGLELPGGFTCANPAATTDDVRLGGYPRFLDVVPGAATLWHRESMSGGGNDPLAPDANALARVAYFGLQNMIDRCAEIPSYYAGPDGDCPWCSVQGLRSDHALRTLYLHYGNCGEMQQMLVASGRTALLPVAPVDGLVQDHVWTELNLGDRWMHYEIGRSDGYFSVDTRRDQDWGAVMRFRGDGFAENATATYAASTFTLDVAVRDRNGTPVDGARIAAAGRNSSGSLSFGLQAWTDETGTARLEFGTGRGVYLQITSPLGALPDADHVSVAACASAEGPRPGACADADVADAVHPLAIAYEHVALPDPAVTETGAPGGDDVLRLRLGAGRTVLTGTDLLTDRTFFDPRGPGAVDVVVVDADNLDAAVAGESHDALRAWRAVGELEAELPVEPGRGDLFVVLSNVRRAGFALEVDARVSHLAPGPEPADAGTDAPEDAAPEDSAPDAGRTGTDEPAALAGSGGCACRTAAGRSPAAGALLLLPAVLLARKRARRR
ncbi:MAG: hypothetical protein JXB32_24455 [Deltaproteobacteria bacterium]|nr:hypothetical protein [Deltaproteobacteria bacterium]